MPTPKDFLERVVVWPGDAEPGYINVHWKMPGRNGMLGRAFRTAEAAISMAQWCASHPGRATDVYFCLSLQRRAGDKAKNGTLRAARSIQEAIALKAVWLDVDVKPEKGYATIDEALDAIAEFRINAGLPAPSAIVYSGGGVHVYWISDRPLSVAEWTPYAHGLRAEALRCGLKFDAGVTIDAARILRIPGTFNYKGNPPTVCKLAHLGDSYPFVADLKTLAAAGVHAAPAVTAAVTPASFDLAPFANYKVPACLANLDHGDKLSAGVSVFDDTPLEAADVLKNCPHFADAVQTGGKGYSQGLWALDLLACTFLEGGRKIAHEVSKGYATYSDVETDKKYDEKEHYRDEKNLGWPACQSFENEGCKQCATCVFKGKIRSPLNLATRTPSAAPQIVATEEFDLLLPDGYSLNADKIICKRIKALQPDGQMFDELKPLFFNRIEGPVLAVCGPTGYEDGIRFRTLARMGFWREVEIKQHILSSPVELFKTLRLGGANFPGNAKSELETFLSAWIARYDREKQRLLTQPFGWVHENGKEAGFAYGGLVFREGGVTTPAGIPDAHIGASYHAEGSADPWYKLMEIITERHMPGLEATVGVSLAAPLMPLLGLYNAVYHIYSLGAGAGKTTAAHCGLAVWASPQMSKESVTATEKGLLKKFAHLRNLPIYQDEVNDDEKLDKVLLLTSSLTEGGRGIQLYQNQDTREKQFWQSMFAVCANKSLWEAIVNKHEDTNARLERVFEVHIEPEPTTRDGIDVQVATQELDHNFGHFGMKYAKLIGSNASSVAKLTQDIARRFNKQVKRTDSERFRAGVASCIFVGAMLANKIIADEHPEAMFNTDELWDYLVREFLRQRLRIRELLPQMFRAEENVDAILGRFWTKVPDNIVHTDRQQMGRGKPTADVVLQAQKAGCPVYVRCNVDDATIVIDEKQFRDFVERDEKRASYENIKTMLKKSVYEAEFGKQRNLGSGGVSATQSKVYVITLKVPPDSAIADVLYKPCMERRLNLLTAQAATKPSSDHNPAPNAGIVGGLEGNATHQA